jgi:hypothetical protein
MVSDSTVLIIAPDVYILGREKLDFNVEASQRGYKKV